MIENKFIFDVLISNCQIHNKMLLIIIFNVSNIIKYEM